MYAALIVLNGKISVKIFRISCLMCWYKFFWGNTHAIPSMRQFLTLNLDINSEQHYIEHTWTKVNKYELIWKFPISLNSSLEQIFETNDYDVVCQFYKMNSLSFILVLLQFWIYSIYHFIKSFLFPISIYFLLRNSTFWFYTPLLSFIILSLKIKMKRS